MASPRRDLQDQNAAQGRNAAQDPVLHPRLLQMIEEGGHQPMPKKQADAVAMLKDYIKTLGLISEYFKDVREEVLKRSKVLQPIIGELIVHFLNNKLYNFPAVQKAVDLQLTCHMSDRPTDKDANKYKVFCDKFAERLDQVVHYILQHVTSKDASYLKLKALYQRLKGCHEIPSLLQVGQQLEDIAQEVKAYIESGTAPQNKTSCSPSSGGVDEDSQTIAALKHLYKMSIENFMTSLKDFREGVIKGITKFRICHVYIQTYVGDEIQRHQKGLGIKVPQLSADYHHKLDKLKREIENSTETVRNMKNWGAVKGLLPVYEEYRVVQRRLVMHLLHHLPDDLKELREIYHEVDNNLQLSSERVKIDYLQGAINKMLSFKIRNHVTGCQDHIIERMAKCRTLMASMEPQRLEAPDKAEYLSRMENVRRWEENLHTLMMKMQSVLQPCTPSADNVQKPDEMPTPRTGSSPSTSSEETSNDIYKLDTLLNDDGKYL